MSKLTTVQNKLGACHTQVVNKLLASHEQVPTVVIIRLKTGKTTIPGCVCENKAISTTSWGLAGWG